MRKMFAFTVVLLVGTFLAAASGTHTLQVKVEYQGQGPVDPDHRIWIFVFDNPNFGQGGSMPIAMASSDTNGKVVEIGGLSADTVYIATMYDEAGGYLAMGPPSPGTPVGVHGDATGPKGIALADTKEVEVYFDDSFRMQ